jgi:hypothetical protein
LQVLYTKLFLVLGLLWSCEAAKGVLNRVYSRTQLESSLFVYYLFRATELLNLLRGFFIFLIFVCKRSVWKAGLAWARGPGRGARLAGSRATRSSRSAGSTAAARPGREVQGIK